MFWETLLRPDDSLSVCDPLVIYPYSIDTLSTRKVMRGEKNICRGYCLINSKLSEQDKKEMNDRISGNNG